MKNYVTVELKVLYYNVCDVLTGSAEEDPFGSDRNWSV